MLVSWDIKTEIVLIPEYYFAEMIIFFIGFNVTVGENIVLYMFTQEVCGTGTLTEPFKCGW